MKNKYFSLIAFLGLSLTLNAAEQKKTIAVLDFEVNSNALAIESGFSSEAEKESSLLTSELIAALTKDSSFNVLERSYFKTLDEERRASGFSISNLSGKAKLLGIDYLIMGNIERFEAQKKRHHFTPSNIEIDEFLGHLAVNLRIIDTNASKVIYADKITEFDAECINEYSSNSPLLFMNTLKEFAVKQLMTRITETISPIQVTSIYGGYVYLNRGEDSSLKRGMKLQVFIPNDRSIDPDTGEVTGSTEYMVGELKVTKILPKVTKAQIIRYSMPIEVGAYCRTASNKSENKACRQSSVVTSSREEPVID